jgi:hypothetical protein
MNKHYNPKKTISFIVSLVLMIILNLHRETANAQALNTYCFSASTSPYSSISATGTFFRYASSDDAFSPTAIPIGFTFNLAGTNYTTCWPNTNGFISFNANAPAANVVNTRTTVLNTVDPNMYPLIAAYKADLQGQNDSGFYQTIGVAPNRVFIMEWKNWGVFFFAAPASFNFQIKLYEGSNRVELNYELLPGTQSSITGTGIAVTNTDFLGLNNLTASPTAAMGTASTTVAGRAATNQLYSFIQPSGTLTYDSSTVVQNTVSLSPGAVNANIISVPVYLSGCALGNVTSMTFNTNGTTNPAHITNARVFYTGGNNSFATANQFGTTVVNPNGTFTVTGSQPVLTGTNFFWLAYDISTAATSTSLIDAECTSLVFAGVARTPVVTAPAGNREIKAPLNGVYTVGATGNFATLTAAVNELTSLGMAGPVTFSLIDPVYSTATGEVFPINIINVPGSGNPGRSITIRPAVGNSAMITGSSLSSLIIVDNTKYVYIDGRSTPTSTSRDLTIQNTNNGFNAGALLYQNDATGAILTYTEIRSANGQNSLFVTPVFGAVTIGGTNRPVPFGNDSIRISNNYFTYANGTTYNLGIVSNGQSIIAQNNNINIDSNNFNGCRLSAIHITGNNTGNGDNFNIRFNNIYDTAVSTTINAMVHINFVPGTVSNNNFIGYNNIGGNAPLAIAGTNKWVFNSASTGSFTGIRTIVGPTTGVTVRANTISNLEFQNTTSFSLFNGINGQTGYHIIDSNVIGSLTDFDNIRIGFTSTHVGIAISFPSQDYFVRANTVSHINAFTASTSTFLRGISYGGSNNNVFIENNLVKSLYTNSSSAGTSTGSSLIGVLVTGSSNAQFIRNNQIGGPNVGDSLAVYNVSGGRVVGIAFSSGVNTVENNNISNLINRSTTSTAGGLSSQVIGIVANSFTAGSIVRNNQISNLRSFGVAATGMTGILLSSGTTNTIGNTLFDFVSFSNNTSTSTASAIVGINVTASNLFNVQFNTMYDFNAVTSASTAIVGIASASTTQNIITNNTIRNLRSNSTGASAINGIFYSNTGGLNQIIEYNTIHSLVSYSSTLTPGITGINMIVSPTLAGNSSRLNANNIHSFNFDNAPATLITAIGVIASGNLTISNNMVRIGRDTSGARNTRGGTYVGIRIPSAFNFPETRVYHNTVLVDANPNAGAGNTFGIEIIGVNTVPGFVDVKSNILVNTSENGGTASGIHSVSAIPTTYTTNLRMGYNLYQAGTTANSFFGRRGTVNHASMTAMKSAYLVDGTSGGANISFINAIGDFATVNLRLTASNAAEGGGDPSIAAFVPVDIDSVLRSTLTPFDIGADAGNFTLSSDSIAPEITFTRLTNGPSVNRTVTATIYDRYGVTLIDSVPYIYFNKNNGTWNSAPGTLISGNQTSGTWQFTITGATMGGVTVGDIIRYFVISKDSLGGNINSEPMFAGSSLVGVTSFPTTPAQYTITDPIPSLITVGPTGTYPTLTGTNGAFAAINNSILQGNTTIELTGSTTEPGAVELIQWNESGAGGYTLTIRPAAATQVILSGTLGNTNGLVRFNNVSRLNLLGFAASGSATDTLLTIRSSSTLTPAIGFINGGSADTIMGVIFESRTTSNAVVFFSSSTNTNGGPFLNNITFRDNLVRQDMTSPISSLPSVGILVTGSSPNFNTNIRIVNNVIYNFTASGINAFTANGGNYFISANSFFYDATATAATHTFINMTPGSSSNGNVISNNWLGGRARFSGGPRLVYTGGVTGITVNTGLTTGTIINNNVIANLTAGTSFTGINVAGSATYSVNGNRIGSVDSFTTVIANGAFRFQGINSTASGDVTFTLDTVVNIYHLNTTATASMVGINVSSGFSNVTLIDRNHVRGLFLNSPNTGTSTTASVIGICVSSGSLSQTISNNNVQTLQNINNVSNHSVYGILATSGANNIINNRVYGLLSRTTSISSNSTITPVIGISNTSFTTGTVNINNNIVDSVYYTGTSTTQVIGIMATPPGSSVTHLFNCNNNIVRNINSSSTSTSTNASAGIVGIHYNNAFVTGTFNSTISGNQISVLNHIGASGSFNIIGLLIANSGVLASNNSTANGNFIHSFRSDAITGTPIFTGILNLNGFMTYTNNMIRLGIDSAGVLMSRARELNGIFQFTGNQSRYYHNTIYLNGAPTVGTSNTFGYRVNATVTVGQQNDFRNNIVVNAVANSGTATGTHFAVQLQDSLRHTMNYNLYHTPGNYMGRINASNTFYLQLEDSIHSWKAVTGLDMTSAAGSPVFTPEADAVADLAILTVSTSNNIERTGDPSVVVANDYFGNSRAANTPSDIGAHAGNFTLANDLFPPAISYTNFSNTGNTTATRTLANVTITDNNGVPTTGANRPQLLYSKDGTTWFVSSALNITGTPTNLTASFNLDQLQLAPLAITDSVFYYVLAQDNAGNTISNAPFAVASGVGLANISNHPLRPANYKFLPVIPANSVFSVGNGQTYPSLTGIGGLFEFLNTRTLGGNISAEITSDITETGLVALNAFAEDGVGGYSLTIRPSAGTTVVRTLQGNLNNPLIVLNGTARVKFLGIPTNGTANQKLIRVRNNGTGAVVQMQNGAFGNRIHNLLVEGGANTFTSGALTFITNAGTVPCTFDTISGCVITNNSTLSLPNGIAAFSIYSQGIAGVFNANNTIMDNEIANFSNSGVVIDQQNGNDWVITGNSFYNNLPISLNTNQYACINIVPGVNGSGYIINNNWIGGTAANAGGTAWSHTGNTVFFGIRYSGGTNGTAIIRNNVIQNMNLNIPAFNTFTGITVLAGNANIGGSVAQGNIVGSTTLTNSIIHNGFSGFTGITFASPGDGVLSGNTVAGIVHGAAAQTGTFVGISFTNGRVLGMENNTVGSTTVANSITYLGSGQITGIQLSLPATFTPSFTVSNNTVSNLTASATQSNISLRGIAFNGTAVPTISNNTISNLNSNSASILTGSGNSVVGIIMQGSSAALGFVNNNTISAIRANNTVSATNASGIIQTSGQSVSYNANRIFDITNASTATSSNPTATAAGIQISSGSTNCFITNNQISLGSGQTTNTQFNGIWVSLNSSAFITNVFNNSVVIGGTASSGANNSYAFVRGNNTGANLFTLLSLRNNIFANTRTGGTGNHYAISNQTTTPSNNEWTNASSQYNLLVSANTNTVGEWGVTARNYSDWLTSSFADNWSYYMQSGTGANQLNLSNLFTNIATGNLGIQTANVESWYVYGKGIAGSIVNNLNADFAGTSRGTTLGTGISIGSIQLNAAPTILPPVAVASATPTANGTTIFRFASRPVITLNWGASAPTSALLYNYAGVNPPSALGGNNLNQYSRVAVSGGSAPYDYTATVHYDPALIGGVTSQGNLRVANETTGSTATSPVWQLQTISTVNTSNNTVTSGAISSNFSNFYFSANENTAPPTINGFTPSAREVGGNVSIRGSLFTGATAVSFNGTSQPTFTVVNDTLITTTVPTGATTGPVSVTNVYGVGTSTTNFTVIPAPTVTNLSVNTGTFGTAVTITGTGFTWATQVQFNTTNATFTVVNNTTITTTVPNGATSGVITVVNPAGSASSIATFTVIGAPTITGFTPANGPVGTTVTINGTNFQAISNVTFNLIASSFTVVSATQITATVPSGATTGAIRVINGSGTAVSATNFVVLPVPTVDAFTPSSGGIGTVVTITGTNFANIDSVEFGGGVNASFTVVNPTRIDATVAAGSVSGLITVYRNGVAGVSSSGNFTVIPDLVVSTTQSVSGTYNNITVTNTGVATLVGSLVALGNTTVQSGGVVNFGTEVLSGNGNFTANSGSLLRIGSLQGLTSTGGLTGNVQVGGNRVYNGRVEFNGSPAQSLGNAFVTGIDTLIINNPSGVVLNNAAVVNNHLVLGNGNLNLFNFNLTLNGTFVANASGYVVTDGTGTLRRTVANNATNVLFPVGTQQSYTPATLQLTAASTTDVFSVRVANAVLSAATSGSIINQSVVNRTWFVSENTAGGSNLTVTLTWDDSLEINTFNRANCAIAVFNGAWSRSGSLGAATGTNPYSRTASGITAFSAFAIGDINATLLPVQLLSFNAKKQGDQVVLDWVTASERNNSRFEIERAVDGVSFENIGTVKGKGNTNKVSKYNFIDPKAFDESNVVYYRLKQVDFDGKFSYSEAIAINNKETNNGELSVYPNPFASGLQLKLNNATDGVMTIEVTDATGKAVVTLTKQVTAGAQLMLLDELSTLQDGVYFMNTTINGNSQRIKLIKVRD